MSAVMTPQTEIAVVPPASLGLAAGVSHAVWYPLHESAGASTVADKFGNGETLTLNGVEGTFWSTWGCATPTSGSTHSLASAANPAYLASICRLDNLASGEILIGYEMQHDGDCTGNETIISYGRGQALVGARGHWSLQMNSLEQSVWSSHAGEGASGTVNDTIPASSTTGVTARILTVVSLTLASAGVVRAQRYSHIVGTGTEPSNVVDSDTLASGGNMPSVDASTIFALMARQTGPSAWDRYLGAAASGASLNNVWLARLSVADIAAGAAALESMIAAPREFPLYLRAA